MVRSTNAALSVPFSFRAVSEEKGSLQVTVEDEYTYFAAGSPRVTNATVILSDALSGRPVLTNYTGADGILLLSNLTEAYYFVDVRADAHGHYRETALVVADQTTNIVAFLPRQTVRYSFTVVPTTIEDRYVFQVDSTFETQVPIPVVTISPSSLDLAAYTGDEFQVQFTVANHGLIAAEHVEAEHSEHRRLRVHPAHHGSRQDGGEQFTHRPRAGEAAAGNAAAGTASAPAGFGTGQCSVTADDAVGLPVRSERGGQGNGVLRLRLAGCDLVESVPPSL